MVSFPPFAVGLRRMGHPGILDGWGKGKGKGDRKSKSKGKGEMRGFFASHRMTALSEGGRSGGFG